MKTHSIAWFPQHLPRAAQLASLSGRAGRVLQSGYRILIAGAAALVVLVAASWLISVPALGPYFQAILWAGGLIFLALSVESEKPLAGALLFVTGLALPTLAWLGSRLAIEFCFVAAILVAGWLAVAIVRPHLIGAGWPTNEPR